MELFDGDCPRAGAHRSLLKSLSWIQSFNEDALQEQIMLGKLQVDKKAKIWESIRRQIQEKRVNSLRFGLDHAYPRVEKETARKLVKAKGMVLNSLQAKINRSRDGTFINITQRKIQELERLVLLETLPRHKRDGYASAIKQLKLSQKKTYRELFKEHEMLLDVDLVEELEECLKILRRELDVLESRYLEAEAAAALGSEQKRNDEFKLVEELQPQCKAALAADTLQETDALWQSLRKEFADDVFSSLVKIPRFDDLKAQIRIAKLEFDEKTSIRDAIKLQILEKYGNGQISGVNFEYATYGLVDEETLRAKRLEIDCLESMINRAKSAICLEYMGIQIYTLNRIIRSGNFPLEEVKLLSTAIRRLEQLRAAVLSEIGSQDDFLRDNEQFWVEDCGMILSMELLNLKSDIVEAETVPLGAEWKKGDEFIIVNELKAEFIDADAECEAARVRWQSLEFHMLLLCLVSSKELEDIKDKS